MKIYVYKAQGMKLAVETQDGETPLDGLVRIVQTLNGALENLNEVQNIQAEIKAPVIANFLKNAGNQ